MLAGELALAGVDVAIVERRASQDLPGSRAGGLHSRTIEVLDQRGIADRFLSEGQVAQVAGFAGTTLDISDFPTRHNYGLGLWQNHIERILAGWVGGLAVRIYRGREVTGIAQAQVERVTGGIRQRDPGWAVGQPGGAEADRPLGLRLGIVGLQVEVELLRMLLSGPLRRDVVRCALELDLLAVRGLDAEPVGIV